MNKQGTLVLTETGVKALNALASQLQQDSGAKAVLLIEKSGTLISAQGATGAMDTISLAALMSGAFASTRALARLIGEKHFKLMFQQGARENVLIASLETGDMVAVVFGPESPIGLVKFRTMQALERLNSQMRSLYTTQKASLSSLSQGLDNLF